MSAGLISPLLLSSIFLPWLCPAKAGEEKKETVEVVVITILATDQNKKIDAKLECIAKQVQKTRKELTGFRMGTVSRKSLAVGEKGTFDLAGDEKTSVTVLQGADTKNRVRLRIAPPGLGGITYEICCGKFLPIFTPIQTKNKETLLFAVCVRTCKE
jgi:hypothetical protein